MGPVAKILTDNSSFNAGRWLKWVNLVVGNVICRVQGL